MDRISLDGVGNLSEGKEVSLIALDDALKNLAAIDPRQSRIVELRYFGGLSIDETAEVLGISPATINRECHIGKIWLLREISTRG